MHRFHLPADVHRGSPRQLAVKLLHDAVDIRRHAAEIAVLDAGVDVDDGLDVVLRRHVRAGRAGNGGQVIQELRLRVRARAPITGMPCKSEYESMRYCGVCVATL